MTELTKIGHIRSIQLRRKTYGFIITGLAFFITIAAIVVSINSTVFKQFDNPSLNSYQFVNPMDILRFAVEQLPSKEGHDLKELEVGMTDRVKRIDYLFLVDVTGSLKASHSKSFLIKNLISKETDLTSGEALEKLTVQSLLTLNMIQDILARENVQRGDIKVAFIRGTVSEQPVSLLDTTSVKAINDDILNKFLNLDIIKDRSETTTYFDEIFAHSFFTNELYKMLSGDYNESKTILTVVSDFRQDKTRKSQKYLNQVDSLLRIHKKRILDQDSDVQLNLVSLDLNDKSIFNRIVANLGSEVFLYHYPLDKSGDALVQDLEQIVTPTYYKRGSSDHFLFSPIKSVKIPHRENLRTFERDFIMGSSREYQIKAISTHNVATNVLRVKSNTEKKLASEEGNYEVPVFKSEIIRIRQERQLAPEYSFSKIDLYDVPNNYRTRIHLWQAESMTKAGALFYAVCVIAAYTLLLTFIATALISTLFVKKNTNWWQLDGDFNLLEYVKNTIQMRTGHELAFCYLFSALVVYVFCVSYIRWNNIYVICIFSCLILFGLFLLVFDYHVIKESVFRFKISLFINNSLGQKESELRLIEKLNSRDAAGWDQ